jgi:hypothetical protein
MTFSVRYNVLNSTAILTYDQVFVPNGQWLAPLSVLTPRFAKIAAQISFCRDRRILRQECASCTAGPHHFSR